jgi:hypothetical protein
MFRTSLASRDCRTLQLSTGTSAWLLEGKTGGCRGLLQPLPPLVLMVLPGNQAYWTGTGHPSRTLRNRRVARNRFGKESGHPWTAVQSCPALGMFRNSLAARECRTLQLSAAASAWLPQWKPGGCRVDGGLPDSCNLSLLRPLPPLVLRLVYATAMQRAPTSRSLRRGCKDAPRSWALAAPPGGAARSFTTENLRRHRKRLPPLRFDTKPSRESSEPSRHEAWQTTCGPLLTRRGASRTGRS